MPNWCENNIKILGPADDIRKFITKIQDPDDGTVFKIAESIMPMPTILGDRAPQEDEEKAQKAIDATGFRDWYEWANSDTNWGTKWGDCDTDLYYDDEQINGYYTTAWSPLSVAFWEEASRQFKSLRIVIGYREEGMNYEGAYAFYGGECYYDRSQEGSLLYQEAVESLDKIKVLY